MVPGAHMSLIPPPNSIAIDLAVFAELTPAVTTPQAHSDTSRHA